jgi:ribonuclease E
MVHVEDAAADVGSEPVATMSEEPVPIEPEPVADTVPEAEAAPKKRGRRKAVEPVADNAPAEKPKRGRGKAKSAVAEDAAIELLETTPEPVAPAVAAAPPPPLPAPEPEIEPEVEDPNRPKRTGWWAKAKKAVGG